ncbi:MAG: dihydrofolate reductase [Bacteroidetes bacterium]|nr:dihydrofolate reductase [Bacteroidota bacterium]
MPVFSIIVAVDLNNVIGLNGDMPWLKLRSDLKYFKEKTSGHWCILGRKTYNALGNKVLPGRKFIIVTRDKEFMAPDSLIVHSLKEAINLPELNDEDEVFVLGGGDIYKQSMQFVTRIYLTRIHAEFEGDTWFPQLDSEWNLVSEDKRIKDDVNPYDHDFLIYEKN